MESLPFADGENLVARDDPVTVRELLRGGTEILRRLLLGVC